MAFAESGESVIVNDIVQGGLAFMHLAGMIDNADGSPENELVAGFFLFSMYFLFSTLCGGGRTPCD